VEYFLRPGSELRLSNILACTIDLEEIRALIKNILLDSGALGEYSLGVDARAADVASIIFLAEFVSWMTSFAFIFDNKYGGCVLKILPTC